MNKSIYEFPHDIMDSIHQIDFEFSSAKYNLIYIINTNLEVSNFDDYVKAYKEKYSIWSKLHNFILSSLDLDPSYSIRYDYAGDTIEVYEDDLATTS